MAIYQYIHNGGSIMYILIGLNIIGLTTMLYKFITLSREKKQIEGLSTELSSKLKEQIEGKEKNVVIEFSKQELGHQMGKMEKGLNTIKIIASIAPLLGLLGTVLGVFLAFQSISTNGMNDPSYFAGGISKALITTVGGLIVAIPHYIGHNYLIGILDDIENGLEQKLLNKIL